MTDRQFVVPLGDLRLRLHPGIVGCLLGLGLLDGHVPVRLGFGYCRVFLDFGGIVHTQILDETVFIHHVLDIAGQDFDTELFHIFGCFCHDLIREGIPVGIDGLQAEGADDLTHIALQGILKLHGDPVRFFIQEVLHGEQKTFLVVLDPDLCHGIHLDVDEVIGWDKGIRFDVNGDLTEIDPVQPLKDGELYAGPSDQDTGRLLDAGDDECHVRGRFNIAAQNQYDHQRQDDRDRKNDREKNCRHSNCSFLFDVNIIYHQKVNWSRYLGKYYSQFEGGRTVSVLVNNTTALR